MQKDSLYEKLKEPYRSITNDIEYAVILIKSVNFPIVLKSNVVLIDVRNGTLDFMYKGNTVTSIKKDELVAYFFSAQKPKQNELKLLAKPKESLFRNLIESISQRIKYGKQ